MFALIFFTGSFLAMLARLFYQTRLHALSRYPGPVLASLISAYAAYHSIKGDLHIDIRKCHDLYGPIIRYGPNKLIFNSVLAQRQIYGYGVDVQKSKSYLPMVPWADGWTVMSCIDKALHKTMRQTLQANLSPEGLRAFEKASIKNIDAFIRLLAQPQDSNGWSSPMDMTETVKRLAIDSMGDLAFGESIGLLRDYSLGYIIDMFDWYTWRTGFFEAWPALWFAGMENLALLFSPFSLKSRKFSTWRESYTQRAVDKNGQSKMGIFSDLALGQPQGKRRHQYTRAQMEAEGSFILLVASDSNATALSAALFYLSRNPSVYTRLTHEIRHTFPNLSSVHSGATLNSCAYLQAFITEVLRIHPPSPGVPWRQTLGPLQVDGHNVPPGTDVGCCFYAMQHGAAFSAPDIFWPERWLPGVLSENELHTAYAAHKPFSLGPRSCAGRAVAMQEISVTLCRLVFVCDLKRCDGPQGRIGEILVDTENDHGKTAVFQFKTHFTAMTEGPFLRFRIRTPEN